MVSEFPPLTVGMSTKEAIELVKANKTLKKDLKDTVIFNSIVDAPYDGVPDKKFEYDTKEKVVAEWNLDSDGEWIKAKK